MKSPVLLDISRLTWGARRASPTGIDRVELAYAQHLMEPDASRPAFLVVHGLGLLFGVTTGGGRRFLRDLAARWQGSARERRLVWIVAVIRTYLRLLFTVRLPGPLLRRQLRKHGSPPIFLVVSHHHVGHAFTIRRIRRVFGARTVCFIHDLIPIEYPQYCRPTAESHRQRAIDNAANLFETVIVNSETTAQSLRAYLAISHRNAPSPLKIQVALPGVRAFPLSEAALPIPQDRPFFVMLSTIEPKKNHMLVLSVWARLAAVVAQPPRLLIIGALGWRYSEVIDMLERLERFRGLVLWRRRMADSDVGMALKGARALLAPSWVEGFGLPLAEALASGTPAICSDIPAFREVGRRVPDYLDPMDSLAWMDAVLEYSRPDSTRRAAQMRRLADWYAPSWTEHFQTVDRLLEDLDPC